MRRLFRKKVGKINIVAAKKLHFKRLEKGLLSLHSWDKAEYKRAQKHIDTVFIHPVIRDYNQTNVKERVWLVGHSLFSGKDFDIPYMASLIIHEAYHIAQFRAGRPYYGAKAEKAAYLCQRKFLGKIKYRYAVAWLDKRFNKKWWKGMDKQRNNKKEMESLWKLYVHKQLKIIDL